MLVVGAGGLGCALLSYLCGAGIGRIVVVDHDRVEEANLHRQPLYRMGDLGLLKVVAARSALQQLNPVVTIDPVGERLTPANTPDLLRSVDLAVDAADSFAVKYMLSDECQRTSKPLVSASVLGLSGYVGSFCGGAPSYRAVFPDLPRQAGSCAASGVLGTAVGVIGTLQAHCVLGLVLGLEPSPLGQITTIDFRSLRIGQFSFREVQEPPPGGPGFLQFIALNEVTRHDVVVDLRAAAEAPISPVASALRMSIEEIEASADDFSTAPRIVLCCRTGVRAWRAARVLERRGYHNLALIAVDE